MEGALDICRSTRRLDVEVVCRSVRAERSTWRLSAMFCRGVRAERWALLEPNRLSSCQRFVGGLSGHA
eukprot:2062276-Pyramimonas_sp.AAC.1